jgi:hypothetical protein
MLLRPSNVIPPVRMKRKIQRRSIPAIHNVAAARALEVRIDINVVISDWTGSNTSLGMIDPSAWVKDK